MCLCKHLRYTSLSVLQTTPGDFVLCSLWQTVPHPWRILHSNNLYNFRRHLFQRLAQFGGHALWVESVEGIFHIKQLGGHKIYCLFGHLFATGGNNALPTTQRHTTSLTILKTSSVLQWIKSHFDSNYVSSPANYRSDNRNVPIRQYNFSGVLATPRKSYNYQTYESHSCRYLEDHAKPVLATPSTIGCDKRTCKGWCCDLHISRIILGQHRR
mmetsp:Transcript_106440/g.168074  ORF Transcript_106440/g.168074 Transcript_106440/m.168074 type:complete len:213 (-) Transcript_106440:85-723(-)